LVIVGTRTEAQFLKEPSRIKIRLFIRTVTRESIFEILDLDADLKVNN